MCGKYSPSCSPPRMAARDHARGECASVSIEKAVYGGLTRTHLDDGTLVFAGNAIEGEQGTVELQYRKKNIWFARMADIAAPSADRIPAPCQFADRCGGCQLQHMAYPAQVAMKRKIVEEALYHEGVPLPSDIRVHAMEHPWAYRYRGEFHVVPGDAGMGDARLGFNEHRRWVPVAVDDCLIHHPTIRSALPELVELVQRGGLSGLSTLHCTVGEHGQELLIRAKPFGMVRDDVLEEIALRSDSSVRWSTDATTLHWRTFAFRITPDTFIQVNWEMMDTLYQCVLDAVAESHAHTILDAYAGIGVMSSAFAAAGADVTCIESNPASVHLGMLNSRMNALEKRLHFVRGSVEDVLAEHLSKTVDHAVLDPPRSGCEPRVVGALVLQGPQHVTYVSCNPSTLARDLHVLAASGPYVPTRMDIVDMFPHTYHVETVVHLVREG